MAFTTYTIVDRFGTTWLDHEGEATLIRVASYLIRTDDPKAFDVIESEHVSMDRAYVKKRTNLVVFCNEHHIEGMSTVSANPRKKL